jgi:predicted RNase H-like nuclease (RuvC/YqgF family)
MKEENEKCHETLEGRLNRHDERIEDQYWIENRLKQQSEDIRTLTAELHTHRKMLKVLKQMPDYQIAAATVAVSAAVTDPKAAREMSQEIKVSAKNEPAWEQESEVNDEN